MLVHALPCLHSLDNNGLVDPADKETGYIKASEVEGDSKEVGSKVFYNGREMVVTKGVDKDGELNMKTCTADTSAIKALAEGLKGNSTLTSLK